MFLLVGKRKRSNEELTMFALETELIDLALQRTSKELDINSGVYMLTNSARQYSDCFLRKSIVKLVNILFYHA